MRQAIQRFQGSKMPDDEADARSTLARSLILQGKLADSQREIDIAAKLGAQDRIVRISLAVTAARLKAHTGRQAEARQDLDSLLNEAKEKNLVGLQLEVRLALADGLDGRILAFRVGKPVGAGRQEFRLSFGCK